MQCHYNFIRPHRALKFGREIRTPAMQAGLTDRRLSFRDVFEQRADSRAGADVLRFPTRQDLARSAQVEVQLAA